MFEDSTFESASRIRTRSRGWMLAALALNGSIVFALILIPLVYPEALPRMAMTFLMEVPPPPATPPPAPPRQQLRTPSGSSNMTEGQILMPRQIPTTISIPSSPEPAGFTNIASMDASSGVPGGIGDAFRSQPAPRIVHAEPKAPARVSSAIAAGLLLHKVIPPYPPLPKAAHISGTIALAATISKDGTIVNLRVVSGPAMLQQTALEAVSQWRYRPYLLNGEPVEVETTINVVFTLGNL